MKIIIALILALTLNVIQSKIVFVAQLYRHGARGPITRFYDGPEQSSIGGQLTSVGMRQHYLLGQAMRKRYIEKEGLLSENLKFDEIRVYSTDYNRTLMSAQSHLQGLYPEGTAPKIPANLDEKYLLPSYKLAEQQDIGSNALPNGIQVMPVHSSSGTYDYVLAPWNFCTKVWDVINEWKALPKQANFQEKLAHDFNQTLIETQKLLNDTSVLFSEIPDVYDVLVSDLYQGRKMPFNFDLESDLWKNITFIHEVQSYFIADQKKNFLNIMNTNLFSEWIDNFNMAIEGTNAGLKMLQYSAHDSNLVYILPGLNMTSYQCIYDEFVHGKTDALNCAKPPGFASNLLVELHEEQGEHFIKIDYNGQYLNLCEQNSTQCSYEEWKNRVSETLLSYETQNEKCRNDPWMPKIKRQKHKSFIESDPRETKNQKNKKLSISQKIKTFLGFE